MVQLRLKQGTDMPKARRVQAERRQESEQKLIQTAIELIAISGYDQLTLSQLGEAAGYSRGIATHFFGTREALMERVVTEILARTSAQLAEGVNPSDTPLEAIFRRLQLTVRRWTRETVDARALMAIFAAGLAKKELALEINERTANGLKWYAQRFREAIEAGLVPESIDPEMEARLLFSVAHGAGTMNLLMPAMEAEEVMERFIERAKKNYALAAQNLQ
jgi:AcrR family transcriptional regulator